MNYRLLGQQTLNINTVALYFGHVKHSVAQIMARLSKEIINAFPLKMCRNYAQKLQELPFFKHRGFGSQLPRGIP